MLIGKITERITEYQQTPGNRILVLVMIICLCPPLPPGYIVAKYYIYLSSSFFPSFFNVKSQLLPQPCTSCGSLSRSAEKSRARQPSCIARKLPLLLLSSAGSPSPANAPLSKAEAKERRSKVYLYRETLDEGSRALLDAHSISIRCECDCNSIRYTSLLLFLGTSALCFVQRVYFPPVFTRLVKLVETNGVGELRNHITNSNVNKKNKIKIDDDDDGGGKLNE